MGTNVIQVTGLSSTTDTESFRVDGLGNARLSVVRCTLDRHPEIPKSDPIRDLASQLRELQTEKRAREKEVAVLRAFGKSVAERRDISPEQTITFSDTLFNKILACGEVTRELDDKITRLNQKINKLRNSTSGEAFTKAIITILADEDGPAQLRLIYRERSGIHCEFSYLSICVGTLDAHWNPLYDLYTTSDGGKPSSTVSLHYRVNIRQYTGEDWTNAKLVLSTSATNILNAGVPEPDNLVVMPPPPPIPPPVSYLACPAGFIPSRSPINIVCPETPEGESDTDVDMGFGLFDDGDPPPTHVNIPPPHELFQTTAVISKNPMTVSYTVETLTTIPSDGVSHKVLVAAIPLEAAITHVTTPRKTPIAYIQVMTVTLLRALG